MRPAGLLPLALAGVVAATGAYAQQAPQQTPPAATAQPAGPPSAEEVSSFTEAYIEVGRIQQQAQAELQQAAPEERPMVEQNMQQQMASAVVENGLTPERFNDIAQQSQSDPELSAQIQQELEATLGR